MQLAQFAASTRLILNIEFTMVSNGTVKSGKRQKVAVITGANTGVGLAIAQRLLSLDLTIIICLACRNMTRAKSAREKLLEDYPKAFIDIIQLDTSCIQSVQSAAEELKNKYSCIDHLYLNAGIMPETTVNWRYVFWLIIHPVIMLDALSTGEGIILVKDGWSKDGLRLIFHTNLFGHFLLVRKLEDYLCSGPGTHIIWTSSSNARRSHFSMDDMQHENGTQSYGSSKHATDLLSIALNDRLKERGVHSHVTCPGFSITGITMPILGAWLWYLLYPLLLLARIIVPIVCITPWNSAESPIWLYQSDPSTFTPDLKYVSCVDFLGNNYVKTKKIDYYWHEPKLLYKRLVKMQEKYEGIAASKRATR